MAPTLSAEDIRDVFQRYVDAMTAGDVDSVVSLYAEDATVEDPVGSSPHVGHGAIRAFYTASAGSLSLSLEGRVRVANNEGACAMVAHPRATPETRIETLDVMRFDAEGRIRSLHAWWSADTIAVDGNPASDSQIRDRLEIDDLLTRYATAVDRKDWALYDTCFTPNAYIDYRAAGGVDGSLSEVRDWLAKTLPMFRMTQHVVVNREIEMSGDTAKGCSIFYNPMLLDDPEGRPRIWIEGGYYHDDLVRTAQGWRIARRVEESSYSTARQRLLQPGNPD